jgi:hypothetical protein
VSGLTLVERILAIDDAFQRAQIPHAFGGALALAYYTDEVRATKDIDVNVFVGPNDAEQVLASLPEGVLWSGADVEAVSRDGQVRLWWDDTPIDLFFDLHAIHDVAASHTVLVPFADSVLPILGSTELAVFKMMFSRPKDWVDIDSMLEARSLDVAAVSAAYRSVMGDDAERLERLHERARAADA